MKRLIIIALALICALSLRAQDIHITNFTALHFAATGGTDRENTLQQFMIHDEAALAKHADLVEKYRVFADEFNQNIMSQAIPEGVKAMEESVAEMKRLMKNHPELVESMQDALRDAEAEIARLKAQDKPAITAYTCDPAQLLREFTAIAIGKKAFTGCRDIEGGLFAVTEAPCYGRVDADNFNQAQFREGDEFSWGAVDAKGNIVIEPKYDGFRNCFAEHDIMFLRLKARDGSVRVGALGYDGRVRIPFEYDYLDGYNLDRNEVSLFKNGRLGIVTMDAKPLVPFKYQEYWSREDGEIKLLREDGKLDVYDEQSYKLLRTEAEP